MTVGGEPDATQKYDSRLLECIASASEVAGFLWSRWFAEHFYLAFE